MDDEGCAAWWERPCWVEEVDDEGFAARWERAALLGGRDGRRRFHC